MGGLGGKVMSQCDCIACLEDPGSMGNGLLISVMVMGCVATRRPLRSSR